MFKGEAYRPYRLRYITFLFGFLCLCMIVVIFAGRVVGFRFFVFSIFVIYLLWWFF
ncbi:MAG: hypothetical protein LBH59_02545 [Planctomycetaceae bacterium]|nr:hypothetical protein [Planctomycetaceae bacterium]